MPERETTRSSTWVLSHPFRLRLFELLSEGPATGADLARRLGVSRGSTSYHLRALERVGAIAEDTSLGSRRERVWRRPEERMVWPTPPDVEGRAITERVTATMFARDADVRRRFVTGDPGEDWRRGAFVGNWFLELTPEEASALGEQVFALVDELRRSRRGSEAHAVLVSFSALPVLD